MLDDKGNISDKIILDEKDKIVRKVKNNAEMMNNYFINITGTVNLKSSKNCNGNDIMESISQCNDHISTRIIRGSHLKMVPDSFTVSPELLGDVHKNNESTVLFIIICSLTML